MRARRFMSSITSCPSSSGFGKAGPTRSLDSLAGSSWRPCVGIGSPASSDVPTPSGAPTMSIPATPLSTPAVGAMVSPKEQFLAAYEREHAITMRVLRAFPPEKADLQPHPRCKTARELAFIFALERGLATIVFNDAFGTGGGPSPTKTPEPPESWNAVLAAVEKTHEDFGHVVRATPEEKLFETVKFFTAPKTLTDVRRIDFLWFI